MGNKATPSINTDDYELSRVQSFLMSAIKNLPTDFPIMNGVLVDAAINTTGTTVEHKLGRVPKGYFVVSQDANSVVWKSASSIPNPNSQIILLASALVNVKLYIF